MSFGTECTLLLLNICVTNDHGYAQLVVIIFQTVPHAWFITGFVTRLKLWMPLVEQELLSLSEHQTSYPVWGGGSCYLIFSFMCMLCRSFCPCVHFGITLSVLLRLTDSDYHFGTFKHLQRKLIILHWTMMVYENSLSLSLSLSLSHAVWLSLSLEAAIWYSYLHLDDVIVWWSSSESNILFFHQNDSFCPLILLDKTTPYDFFWNLSFSCWNKK